MIWVTTCSVCRKMNTTICVNYSNSMAYLVMSCWIGMGDVVDDNFPGHNAEYEIQSYSRIKVNCPKEVHPL